MTFSVSSFAKSEFLDLFMSTYKISDDSALGQKSCLICHNSEDDFSKFNLYGADLKKELATENKTDLDAHVLQVVGALDSNGSGTTNDQKIHSGTAPGEPGPKTVAPAPEQPKPKSLIPKNFFHPAVVHFPIALFIAAVLLDAIGMAKHNRTLLNAGWYNLLLAVITSFGGIATGFGAMWIQKIPFKGVIFEHMCLALSAAVMMAMMMGLRVHRQEKMHLPSRIAYHILAITCFIVISYAGHLGGAFVYGE